MKSLLLSSIFGLLCVCGFAQPKYLPMVASGEYYPLSLHEPYYHDSIYFRYDGQGRKTKELHVNRESLQFREQTEWIYEDGDNRVTKIELTPGSNGRQYDSSISVTTLMWDDQDRVMTKLYTYRYNGGYHQSSYAERYEYEYYEDSLLIHYYRKYDTADFMHLTLQVYSSRNTSGPGFSSMKSYFFSNGDTTLSYSLSEMTYANFNPIDEDLNYILSGKRHQDNVGILTDTYFKGEFSDTAYKLIQYVDFDGKAVVAGKRIKKWDDYGQLIYQEYMNGQGYSRTDSSFTQYEFRCDSLFYSGTRILREVEYFKHELFQGLKLYSEVIYGLYSPTLISDGTTFPELSIGPNPATDVIHVRGLDEEFAYTILDMQGRTIKEAKSTQDIPVNELNPGVYILVIKTENRLVSERFLR